MNYHEALGYSPIQYTALIGSTLIGYYLNSNQDTARVHRISPTGNVSLGECAVAFPHAQSVAAYVREVA